ncbi:MAG TPA: hypothetical protein VF257_16955 [Solirubrobacteraceae bacterium]
MREFCTLFDSNYLVKAVAMYRSLLRHRPDARLTAFCFDDEAKAILDELALPQLSTVSLAELETSDPALLSTKGDRSAVEYCWTATPALPRFLFATRPELREATYLDADLLFFADPEPLFAEMGDASVLITPHRFSPEYAHQAQNGIFNVQFLVFRRDGRGEHVLQWWHDRCIEWCYYRLEDGKLGDQKYLDDWPERFEGVHVLRHKGGGLAPWNISQYDLRPIGGDRVMVDEDELVFYHYHRTQLRRRGAHAWQPPGYEITKRDRELVYDPYLIALDAAAAEIRRVRPGFDAGFTSPPPLRQRVRDARATLGARAVTRYPILLRLRHPIASRAGRLR